MPYPGPWIQPGDTETETGLTELSIAADGNDPPGEPSFVKVTGTGAPTFTTATLQGGTALTSVSIGLADDSPLAYGHNGWLGFAGIDLGALFADPLERATFMPPVVPTWPPGVVDVELEDPGGAYISGGFDLDMEAEDQGSYWVDDMGPKTADPGLDLFSARVQWRRFPASGLTFDGPNPTGMASSAWPAVTGALLLDEPVADDSSQIDVQTVGPPRVDNQVGTVAVPPRTATVHLDDGDLDSGQKLALVLSFDRLVGNAAYWSVPYWDSVLSPAPEPYSSGVLWKESIHRGSAVLRWTYRPPRYRWIFAGSRVLPPLRQRQRDDLRQRQRTSRQRGIRQRAYR